MDAYVQCGPALFLVAPRDLNAFGVFVAFPRKVLIRTDGRRGQRCGHHILSRLGGRRRRNGGAVATGGERVCCGQHRRAQEEGSVVGKHCIYPFTKWKTLNEMREQTAG